MIIQEGVGGDNSSRSHRRLPCSILPLKDLFVLRYQGADIITITTICILIIAAPDLEVLNMHFPLDPAMRELLIEAMDRGALPKLKQLSLMLTLDEMDYNDLFEAMTRCHAGFSSMLELTVQIDSSEPIKGLAEAFSQGMCPNLQTLRLEEIEMRNGTSFSPLADALHSWQGLWSTSITSL